MAALLLKRRPLSRAYLIGLLLPDLPEQIGRRRLSDALWLLRRSLPGLPLQANADALEIPAPSRWLDVEAFTQQAAGNDLAAWLEALRLYQAPLLPDCFDDWLLVERERCAWNTRACGSAPVNTSWNGRLSKTRSRWPSNWRARSRSTRARCGC